MSPQPVVTVTLNPAIDQTLSIPGFAAGRVNRVAESRSHAGGKGVNVACFLADLGVEVIATGFLGVENENLFVEAFKRKGIEDRFVRIAGATRVGIKIVDDWMEQTTDINFPGLTPTKEETGELFEGLASLSQPDMWFVLSGSVPSGVPDTVYAEMIESIHAKGGHVLLDTSGRPLQEALASRPEVIKPNAQELGELIGGPVDVHGAVRAATEFLRSRGLQRVVVSMSNDGAVFVEPGRALLARPPRVKVRSTVGAGDAMVAGIVYATIRGLPLPELARVATASGAYAVTRIGTGLEDREEHRKLMEQVGIEPLE